LPYLREARDGVMIPDDVNRDRVPQPDPTRLTNDAFDRAAEQFRREVAQLKELIERIMHVRDAMLDERYETQTKALDVASQASEKRFEDQARMIKALSDRVAELMPRQEYDTAHNALEDKVTSIETRFNAMELRFSTRLERGESQQAGAQSVTGTGFESAVVEATGRAVKTGQLISAAGVVIAIVAIAVSVIIATR
jgi:hypothetical protein